MVVLIDYNNRQHKAIARQASECQHTNNVRAAERSVKREIWGKADLDDWPQLERQQGCAEEDLNG